MGETSPSNKPVASPDGSAAAVAGTTVTYDRSNRTIGQRGCSMPACPGRRAYDLAHIAAAYERADHAVTPHVDALLGRPPKTLADFLRDHADDYSRRTTAAEADG